jgi:hypothetical protein
MRTQNSDSLFDDYDEEAEDTEEDEGTGLECDECGAMDAIEFFDPSETEEEVSVNLCRPCRQQRNRDF